MTNISKEAVERAAKWLLVRMTSRSPEGYVVKEVVPILRAQASRIAELEAALATARNRLDASLFSNSEHAQARRIICAALGKEPT